jgi:hypothetical protein
LEENVSRLLVTLLAVLTIAAMPLSGGVAANSADIYQLAHQSVTVTPDGFFAIRSGLSVTDNARLHGVFDSLNARLASVDRSHRLPIKQQQAKPGAQSATAGGKLAALAASFCGYVPRWAFEAFAWYVIIVGGVVATVSLFVDATIFGLPAGAVLGAAGIWVGMTGSALLWYVDTYMPPWGVYECIF